MEHLLFCLFPSFKERVMLPFEASVRIVVQSIICVFATLCSFWECKGSKFCLLSTFEAKKFLYFFVQFSALPIEAGCKGKVAFLGFARDLKNKSQAY